MFAAHTALLPLWLFLWLVVPIAILIDDGRPVFYRQSRMGKNGVVFDALKFRTMVRDAEKLGPAWSERSDPRLTRVGKILRTMALDEMPQFVNILRGEMSFVGPRALATEETRLMIEQVPGFQLRLVLTPGLTGLAQVYGDRADPAQKLRLDLEYTRRAGLWLDAKLVLLSVWKSLRGQWD